MTENDIKLAQKLIKKRDELNNIIFYMNKSGVSVSLQTSESFMPISYVLSDTDNKKIIELAKNRISKEIDKINDELKKMGITGE